jgi:hypothetical protein
VILVPVGVHIEPECEKALIGLERRGYSVWRVPGYAAIDQARNELATAALAQGFDETMWIDADVSFDPAAVDRLRSHGLPIVCGIYARKGQRALACHVLPGTSQVVFGAEGGLTELFYAGTGFLLVRRQVYADMKERLKLPVCNERMGRPAVPFFQPLVVSEGAGHLYLPEDYAFCERARQCGYKIMADTSIRLWHHGSFPYGWEDAGMDQSGLRRFTLMSSDLPHRGVTKLSSTNARANSSGSISPPASTARCLFSVQSDLIC